ncbi:hypothetical protein CDD83_10394 [Cordyceps sp. RAO-2017]|nr:hypothetical protein CDD83_10394 [Cordyceps sp. RAO-2017]
MVNSSSAISVTVNKTVAVNHRHHHHQHHLSEPPGLLGRPPSAPCPFRRPCRSLSPEPASGQRLTASPGRCITEPGGQSPAAESSSLSGPLLLIFPGTTGLPRDPPAATLRLFSAVPRLSSQPLCLWRASVSLPSLCLCGCGHQEAGRDRDRSSSGSI